MVGFLVNLLVWFFIIQVSTIIHEMGHAIPALFFTKNKVIVSLGIGEVKKEIKFHRVHINLKKIFPTSALVYWNHKNLSIIKSIIIFSGGPIISIFMAIIQFILGKHISNTLLSQFLITSSYYNFYIFFVTIIPIVYPNWWIGYSGHRSDGHNVLGLCKSIKNKVSES